MRCIHHFHEINFIISSFCNLLLPNLLIVQECHHDLPIEIKYALELIQSFINLCNVHSRTLCEHLVLHFRTVCARRPEIARTHSSLFGTQCVLNETRRVPRNLLWRYGVPNSTHKNTIGENLNTKR